MNFENFFPYIPHPLMPGYQFSGPVPQPQKDPDGWISCAVEMPPIGEWVEVDERIYGRKYIAKRTDGQNGEKNDGSRAVFLFGHSDPHLNDFWRKIPEPEHPWISVKEGFPPPEKWVEVRKNCGPFPVILKLKRPICTHDWQNEYGERCLINDNEAHTCDQWRYLKEQTTEKKVMNFDEAMKEYAAGKKVRRVEWNPAYYISKGMWDTGYNGVHHGDAKGNWEIYDEQRQRVCREIAACEGKLAQLRRSL